MGGILIFGNGYIGNLFKQSFIESEISTVNIADRDAVKKELERKKPDVVINCAGKTGNPNIDWCEDHKSETFNSNVIGPLVLAHACSELNLYLVHLSSGCIYSGDNNGKGFSEDDPPNFFGSFYSKTKVWTEQALTAFSVLQLRLRMPIDGVPSPRNLITKITKYSKVIKVPNSVSVLDDVIFAAKQLISKRKVGIYNVTNPGAITHPEILDMYKEIVDPEFKYEVFKVEELKKIVMAERSNCILSTQKLESEGIQLTPVKDAVRNVLKKYKEQVELLKY